MIRPLATASFVFTLAAALVPTPTLGCGYSEAMFRQWTTDAVSPDSLVSAPAIERLRGTGPMGLEVMLDHHAEAVARLTSDQRAWSVAPEDEHLQRVAAALDAVAGQKDAAVARLYWHTDLQVAKAYAQARHLPILSLRLLGRLDEELSCANSRFFRTALYADEAVAAALGEEYILHWESVRPVPTMSVDFGDGRRIECTITGNSVHYVLDANGRFIDAVPGLYAPRAFLAALAPAATAARAGEALDDEAYGAACVRYHRERLVAVEAAWQTDLARGGITARALPVANAVAHPTAQLASQRAFAKRDAEVPFIAPVRAPIAPEQATSAQWATIAALHREEATLDASSRRLMRLKHPTAWEATRVAMTKAVLEDPMLRVIRNFERSLAEDTVRNEYVLHHRLHRLGADGFAPACDLGAADARIYADLFLSPLDDPWLGLAPAAVYTALPERGTIDANTTALR
jgi:hypothetical protein